MAAQQTGVSQKSIVQMYQLLRDICSAKLVALNGENHRGNFVDPVTGVLTQASKSYEGRKKRYPKRMNGKRAAKTPSYLDQYMWEDRFGKQDMLDNILQHIAEQYRV